MLILSANLEYKKCIYNKCIATTTYIYTATTTTTRKFGEIANARIEDISS